MNVEKVPYAIFDFWNIDETVEYSKLGQAVIEKCFEIENLKNKNLYVNIIFTNPGKIKEINQKYRDIDKETDVLSFPMLEVSEIELKQEGSEADILGDIIISIERVKEQAIEYGHSFERELAYMMVHGFYHLMGYDHMVEEDKVEMREKEEFALNELNIMRN